MSESIAINEIEAAKATFLLQKYYQLEKNNPERLKIWADYEKAIVNAYGQHASERLKWFLRLSRASAETNSLQETIDLLQTAKTLLLKYRTMKENQDFDYLPVRKEFEDFLLNNFGETVSSYILKIRKERSTPFKSYALCAVGCVGVVTFIHIPLLAWICTGIILYSVFILIKSLFAGDWLEREMVDQLAALEALLLCLRVSKGTQPVQ